MTIESAAAEILKQALDLYPTHDIISIGAPSVLQNLKFSPRTIHCFEKYPLSPKLDIFSVESNYVKEFENRISTLRFNSIDLHFKDIAKCKIKKGIFLLDTCSLAELVNLQYDLKKSNQLLKGFVMLNVDDNRHPNAHSKHIKLLLEDPVLLCKKAYIARGRKPKKRFLVFYASKSTRYAKIKI